MPNDETNNHHSGHNLLHHSLHRKHHSHRKSILNFKHSLLFKRRRHGRKHNGYNHGHKAKYESLTINKHNDASKMNIDNLSMRKHLDDRSKIEENLQKKLNGGIITKTTVINGHINKIDGFIEEKKNKNKHKTDKAKNYNDNSESKSTKHKKHKKQKFANKSKKILNHKNKTNHNDNTEIRIFRSVHSHRAHYPFNETRQNANISIGNMKSHSISNERYRNKKYRKKHKTNIINFEKKKSVLKEGNSKKDHKRENIVLTGYDEVKMKKRKTQNFKRHQHKEKRKFHKKRHLNGMYSLENDKFVANMASEEKERKANIDDEAYWDEIDDNSFSDDEGNDAGSGFEESFRNELHEKTNLLNYDNSYEDIEDVNDLDTDDSNDEEYEKLRQEEENFKKYRSSTNNHSAMISDFDSEEFHVRNYDDKPTNITKNATVKETQFEYFNLSDEAVPEDANGSKPRVETIKQSTDNFLACFHKLRNVISNHMRTLKQEEDDVVGEINLCKLVSFGLIMG